MPWFNVDDKFWSHPKFLSVGFGARGLWVSAGSWCAQNLTDGWLPEGAVAMVAMGRDVADLVAQLEAADLWVKGVGGWQFKDWTDWNKPREWHEKKREQNRERQRLWALRGAEKRWEEPPDDTPYDDEPNAVTNALGDALLTCPNPTQPSSTPVVEKVDAVATTDRSAIANDKRFDAFWAIAVRKTGKGNARKALAQACKKTSEHHLAAAWRTANQAWATWPDRTKVPHPATWLNQERWDDDPPQPHTRTTTSKTLSALDRATQMEMNDDTLGLPTAPRTSLPAGPTGHAG